MKWELSRWEIYEQIRHRFKRDISIKEFCLLPWENDVENTKLDDEQIEFLKKFTEKL